ncbi:hypothetical protein [Streptosporangium sp. NPDC002721]|uniref:hypothetical protein n=1 Tax=Streptosporangium sp. NPDC002721 TaxID=3366188 RepID=UPI0036A9CB57
MTTMAQRPARHEVEVTGHLEHCDGRVEALRNLRIARCSAVRQRATTQRQLKALIVTAPEPVRAPLATRELIAVCAALRPDWARHDDPATAVKIASRSLARRHQHLAEEIDDLDELIEPLVQAINPALMTVNGIGPEVAG